MDLDEIDLTEPELYRQGFPHEVFSTLRKEAPVWRHPETPGFDQIGGEGFIVLSRYEDIRNVNRNADLFLSSGGSGLGFVGMGFMLTEALT